MKRGVPSLKGPPKWGKRRKFFEEVTQFLKHVSHNTVIIGDLNINRHNLTECCN